MCAGGRRLKRRLGFWSTDSGLFSCAMHVGRRAQPLSVAALNPWGIMDGAMNMPLNNNLHDSDTICKQNLESCNIVVRSYAERNLLFLKSLISCQLNLFARPIHKAENVLERNDAVIAKNKCPVEDQMRMDSKARGWDFNIAQSERTIPVCIGLPCQVPAELSQPKSSGLLSRSTRSSCSVLTL